MTLKRLEIGELYYLTNEDTKLMIFVPIDENIDPVDGDVNDYDIKALYFRSKSGKRTLGEIAILMNTHLVNIQALEDADPDDQKFIIETIFKYENKAK